MSDPVIAVEVEDYYDNQAVRKLRDFVNGNARVARAAELLHARAPKSMRRALEIGCGIGAMSWRLAKTWPECQVVASDISPKSIEFARALFRAPNLEYRQGLIQPTDFREPFDLVLLIDVYEHVPLEQRPALHSTIDRLLADGGMVVMTTPTPSYLAYLRAEEPDEIQPVDMDIDMDVFCRFAKETRTEIIYHNQLSIWRRHDYAHTIFQRDVGLPPAGVEAPPRRYQALRQAIDIVLKGRPSLYCPPRSQRLQMVANGLGREILDELGLEGRG